MKSVCYLQCTELLVQCTVYYVSSNDEEQSEANPSQWGSQMERMLLDKPGVSTRCMNASVHTIKYATALAA